MLKLAAAVLSASLLMHSTADAKSRVATNCRTATPFGFSSGGHIVNPGIPYGAPFFHAGTRVPAYCQPRR